MEAACSVNSNLASVASILVGAGNACNVGSESCSPVFQINYANRAGPTVMVFISSDNLHFSLGVAINEEVPIYVDHLKSEKIGDPCLKLQEVGICNCGVRLSTTDLTRPYSNCIR